MLFKTTTKRVVHITFHKCGSQWVRDVLVAPEIAAFSHFQYSGQSPNLVQEKWPVQAEQTVMGPLYYARPSEFLAKRKSGDKAIFVTRDPRDRMISYVFSVAYSHVGQHILREPLSVLNTRQKIQFGIYDFGCIAGVVREWGLFGGHPDIFCTSYEKILKDEYQEYDSIFQFLGWPIPNEVLRSVVNRLSFKARSGRDRGETNMHSHFRKGEPGDWRNYFDQSLGRQFEEAFPALLVDCKYESSPKWFESLPESLPGLDEGRVSNENPDDLRAELIRVNEVCNQLRQKLEIKELNP